MITPLTCFEQVHLNMQILFKSLTKTHITASFVEVYLFYLLPDLGFPFMVLLSTISCRACL